MSKVAKVEIPDLTCAKCPFNIGGAHCGLVNTALSCPGPGVKFLIGEELLEREVLAEQLRNWLPGHKMITYNELANAIRAYLEVE